MINDLPDVFEVVRDSQQPAEDKPGKDYSCEASGTRTRSFIKVRNIQCVNSQRPFSLIHVRVILYYR